MANSRMMFVNLSVRNLERAKEFWTKLGFEFNPQFSDDKAACMIVSDKAFVMLLAEERFRDFTQRQICDRASHSEGLFALSASSREDVETMVKTAIALGGTHAMGSQDHGFMFVWSFYDLDGHHWEVAWMDPSAIPSQ